MARKSKRLSGGSVMGRLICFPAQGLKDVIFSNSDMVYEGLLMKCV